MLDGLLAIILVFLGGAIGSIWRYSWSGFVAKRLGENFPFGTLIVNLLGSVLIGIFSALLVHHSTGALTVLLKQFLIIGVCGGLTTFSSFSLQTYNLMVEGRWLSALANIVFSTGCCLACVAIGWQSTRWVNF